ncbi:MAG: hypothetical protein KBG20_21550 [Caldilineaceae bacterium]|nr:hypothetical protein [Caldilineaceae bacterium]MBP8110203.1 hypothetical protein [Caldilineaceae bacterium]MBP8125253.1 hypothetical protein [Caldilineaceae bacterium]MBP9074907.1 hypothetical protein [Caldilineaceae bacterium]
MATATTPSASDSISPAAQSFSGPKKNLVTGVAMTAAGLMAFNMGMTETFFIEAMAWTFLIWGVLMVYSNLLEMNETYTLTDEALTVTNPMRFWGAKRTWQWKHINRMDLTIKRNDPSADDVKVFVFYTPPTQPGVLNRVDLAYNAELLKALTSRANLKAEKGSAFANLDVIPQDSPGVYSWK